MSNTDSMEFMSFIKQNQNSFYRLAAAYTKNRDDALDAVSEAIMKAYEKLNTLKDYSSMKTWFYRILVNCSIDILRRSKRIVITDEIECSNINIADEAHIDDFMDLYNAIDKLPEKTKTVIFLRFFEDMRLEEISKVTGLRLSTVKARLYNGIKTLKTSMSA